MEHLAWVLPWGCIHSFQETNICDERKDVRTRERVR
jgi:hypothetical protein